MVLPIPVRHLEHIFVLGKSKVEIIKTMNGLCGKKMIKSEKALPENSTFTIKEMDSHVRVTVIKTTADCQNQPLLHHIPDYSATLLVSIYDLYSAGEFSFLGGLLDMFENVVMAFIVNGEPPNDEQYKEKIKLEKDLNPKLQKYNIDRYIVIDSSLTGREAERQSKEIFGKLFCKLNVDLTDKKEPTVALHTDFERKVFRTRPLYCHWSFILKSQTSKHLLLICFICFTTPLSATENEGDSITVELGKKPVIFTHDVVLVCTIQTTETPGHMAWIKIPYGETIAVNDKTLNYSKYEVNMKYESSAMKYNLTIKKFAQSDVNSLYRCDSGFLSQSEELKLNQKDYIAMPGENEIKRNISINDGYLQGTIQVNNVYPVVNSCTAIFEGEDLTSQLQMNNSNKTTESIFYNVVIKISHGTLKCEGRINITCNIGSEGIQLMDEYITKCSTEQKIWLIVVLAITASFVVITSVVVFCKRETLKHLCFEQTQKVRGNAASEAVPMNITNLQDTDPEMCQSSGPGDDMEFKT